MDQNQTNLTEICLTGITVRTTNEHRQSQNDIAGLWKRFYLENIPSRILHKLDNELYCVYFDYESDFTKAYSTLLGYKTKPDSDTPGELQKIILPVTRYAVFESVGSLPESLMATWARIWQLPLKRKYAADFDVYPENAFTDTIAVVKTYVSIL